MSKTKCSDAGRYLAFILANNSPYYGTSENGMAVPRWDCPNKAKCALERFLSTSTLKTGGWDAFVIDLETGNCVARANSPKIPIVDWQEPSSPASPTTETQVS